MNKLVIGLITYNEDIHLERCINNISQLKSPIFILDSFSTDKTKHIASKYNLNFFESKFVNYSNQRKKLLNIIKANTNVEYVLFLDADEYLSKNLINEVNYLLKSNNISKFDGYFLKRKFIWKKNWIRYGNYYPRFFMRLARINKIKLDTKPVNEHYLCLSKNICYLKHDIVDENLNGVKYWIKKHVRYARYESMAYFNEDNIKSKKYICYDKLPLIIRVFLYFFYIFFIKKGFFDGFTGSGYHILHSFFYRMVIDYMIIIEILKRKIKNGKQ